MAVDMYLFVLVLRLDCFRLAYLNSSYPWLETCLIIGSSVYWPTDTVPHYIRVKHATLL